VTIAAADGPIREASDAIQAHRDNFQNEKYTAEASLQSHVESINSLESANTAVEKWVDSDGPRRLKKLEEQMTQKENEVQDSKIAVQEIEDTIKQIETDIHTADKNRKNMDDNLRHRQFKAKKRNAETERDNLDVNNARIARADYEREYAKSKKTEQDLTSQHATLMGEISSLKVQAKELKDTLATEYKNIKPDYMGKLIEVKVSTITSTGCYSLKKAKLNSLDLDSRRRRTSRTSTSRSTGRLWTGTSFAACPCHESYSRSHKPPSLFPVRSCSTTASRWPRSTTTSSISGTEPTREPTLTRSSSSPTRRSQSHRQPFAETTTTGLVGTRRMHR
jgi:DNA repair exonuclease SbcCD ATPase subunit